MTENPDKEVQEIRAREKFPGRTGFLPKRVRDSVQSPIAERKNPYQVHRKQMP